MNEEFEKLHLGAPYQAPVRVYVVARSRREYDDYVKVSGLWDGARYVSRAGSLEGLRNPVVHLIGYYYERRDWDEMKHYLSAIRAEVTIVEYWR